MLSLSKHAGDEVIRNKKEVMLSLSKHMCEALRLCLGKFSCTARSIVDVERAVRLKFHNKLNAMKYETIKSNLLAKGYDIVFNRPVEDVLNSISTEFNQQYTIQSNDLIPNKNEGKFLQTLSTTYGYDKFPYHTDGAYLLIPPRWIVLESINSVNFKTATLLVDKHEFCSNPEYHHLLNDNIYLVTNGRKHILTSIINNVLSNIPIFRWNPLLMKSIIKSPHFILSLIPHCEVRVEWMPNQILIIDNWRILHAREAVFEEEKYTRRLKRYSLTPKI